VSTPPEGIDTSQFFHDESRERIQSVRDDIAGRLEKSCEHLSRAEFMALIEKMARVQLGENRPR
jgi:hypothetical protein